MKQGYTHISFLLDKSGSMDHLFNDTVGGFNAFVDSQKKAEGTATFSLTQFSTDHTLIYSFVDIQEVPELSTKNYIIGGGTALYDAIAITINGCGAKLADMDETDRPEKVIFVILTDGEENSSKEYSHKDVQDMIKEQTEKYSWEFVFLGANINAEVVGTGLGIKFGNSMTFMANAKGVDNSFRSVGEKMTSYRGMNADMLGAGYSFFDENDRKQQEEAKTL